MTPRTATPASGVLDTRALNRALLARQMLLEREKVSVVNAVERLVGMQAQIPRPPFMGLWTRVKAFDREDLRRAFHAKTVVRATAMRGTIHILSARDFRRFRPLLAPALVKGAQSIVGRRTVNMDIEAMYAAGRAFFSTAAPFDDFRKHLERKRIGDDIRAIAYTVRLGVPLVMVPTDDTWGFPSNAGFLLAEQWLGASDKAEATLEMMVTRYLAAFGPATPADATVWSGIRGLRDVFEKLRPRLATFRDDRKRELFDLPDAPRPDADTPVPIRFLPEYDNAVLSHDDRRRIIADEHRPIVIYKNLSVRGTFLVDGFVAGIWRSERKTKSATMALTPFVKISRRDVAEVEREGGAALAFLEPTATTRSVRWEKRA